MNTNAKHGVSHAELLDYSIAAYAVDENKFKESIKEGKLVSSYLGDALQTFTIERDDCYIIVYRGSTTKYDWINNVTNFSCSDELQHVNVDQGFLSQISAELNPRLDYDKPIYLCGHSLGGALAILNSFRLIKMNEISGTKNNLLETVVFGAPMVGAQSFFDDCLKLGLSDKITIYRNGDDVTPLLPPVSYKRVGKLVELGTKHSAWNPIKIYRCLEDHRIMNYFNSLKIYNNQEINNG